MKRAMVLLLGVLIMTAGYASAARSPAMETPNGRVSDLHAFPVLQSSDAPALKLIPVAIESTEPSGGLKSYTVSLDVDNP
jgi:hypothetical protein